MFSLTMAAAAAWTASAASTTTCSSRCSPVSVVSVKLRAPASCPAAGPASGLASPSSPSRTWSPRRWRPRSTASTSRRTSGRKRRWGAPPRLRLAPETFSGFLRNRVEEAAAIRLPCFDRTVSLVLRVYAVPVTPPPAGEFSRLESLELTTGCNIFAALLPNFPRLRVLRVHGCQALEVTVHSSTIEELAVECSYCSESGTRRIDIDAPELKKANLQIDMSRELDVSFSAPKVEKQVWEFVNTISIRCVGVPMLGLYMLRYSLKDGVRKLRVDVHHMYGSPFPERSFA